MRHGAMWTSLANGSRSREKLDLGFTPKDKEEGSIPIPDSLVSLLQARRKRYPNTRLIFGRSDGKPDGHFLRTLQRLAFRARLNCRQCYSRQGPVLRRKGDVSSLGLAQVQEDVRHHASRGGGIGSHH